MVHQGPALRAEVNRLQMSMTRRLNKWRNIRCSATHESLDSEDHSLWRIKKTGNDSSYYISHHL